MRHEEETLMYHGISIGAGAGPSVFLSKHVVCCLEGVASFGRANWGPFLNSTGTEYNPSMLGLSITFSYLWAEEDGE
jgi:hypothetical protein